MRPEAMCPPLARLVLTHMPQAAHCTKSLNFLGLIDWLAPQTKKKPDEHIDAKGCNVNWMQCGKREPVAPVQGGHSRV